MPVLDEPKPWVLGLPRAMLREIFEGRGVRGYRANQLFSWVHAAGVLDPASMTDLPLGLREDLGAWLDMSEPRVIDRVEDDQGTVKLLLGLADGYGIEAVVLPKDDEAETTSTTLCISTQVGCRVGCMFCRSGAEGFRRNLDAAEVVAQAHAARAADPRAHPPSRIVFMGIGEPMDNYEAVATAIRILTDEQGLAMAHRRIVVSTVGRVRGIRRLAEDFEGRVGLALSLHSADPEVRAQLVGKGVLPDPGPALAALREYPLPAREKFTVEIVLVMGLNDSPGQARLVAAALRGLRCRVNLIPLNPFEGLDHSPPDQDVVEKYATILRGSGLATFVRQRRGHAILAACGQLAFGRS